MDELVPVGARGGPVVGRVSPRSVAAGPGGNPSGGPGRPGPLANGATPVAGANSHPQQDLQVTLPPGQRVRGEHPPAPAPAAGAALRETALRTTGRLPLR